MPPCCIGKKITKGTFLCPISLYSALNQHLFWTLSKFAGPSETQMTISLEYVANRGVWGYSNTGGNENITKQCPDFPGLGAEMIYLHHLNCSARCSQDLPSVCTSDCLTSKSLRPAAVTNTGIKKWRILSSPGFLLCFIGWSGAEAVLC